MKHKIPLTLVAFLITLFVSAQKNKQINTFVYAKLNKYIIASQKSSDNFSITVSRFDDRKFSSLSKKYKSSHIFIKTLEGELESAWEQVEKDYHPVDIRSMERAYETLSKKPLPYDVSVYKSEIDFYTEYNQQKKIKNNQQKEIKNNQQKEITNSPQTTPQEHIEKGIERLNKDFADNFTIKEFKKALALEPTNAEANYWLGVTFFKSGSSLYYLYKSLEHLSNAKEYGWDEDKIWNLVDTVSLMGEKQKGYIYFDQKNLHKISSSYQKKNKQNIKTLKSRIDSVNKKDVAVNDTLLLKLYADLVGLERYHFSNGHFQSNGYNKARRKKAYLDIKVGDKNMGCSELHKLLEWNHFATSVKEKECKEWYDIYSEERAKKYIEENRAKAKKWYSKHPNQIKLLSLVGANKEEVDSYLGKAIASNYKINVGTGLYGNTYIGNKHKTKDGVYEVAYRNGILIYICFYPAYNITYSPEAFDSPNSNFDTELPSDIYQLEGTICMGETTDGHIGDIKTYSIKYNCSRHHIDMTFYGKNGKVNMISIFASF